MSRITHEEYVKRRDAIICLGLPYMNESWAKFPHEQWHMIEAFKHSKGYKEAKQAIDQLFLDMVGDNESVSRAANSPQVNSIMGQNMLRKQLRTIIKGDQ